MNIRSQETHSVRKERNKAAVLFPNKEVDSFARHFLVKAANYLNENRPSKTVSVFLHSSVLKSRRVNDNKQYSCYSLYVLVSQTTKVVFC